MVKGLDNTMHISNSTKQLTCKRPGLVFLISPSGRREVCAYGCRNHWDCESCREVRRRRIQGRVKSALARLLDGSYRRLCGWLLTFTIDSSEGSRYGTEARERLAQEVNRFGARVSKLVKRAGSRCLWRMRVYEYHKDGALHCHVLLVFSSFVPVASAARGYSLGYYRCDALGSGDIAKAVNYCSKYAIKGSEASYVPHWARVASARLYSLSGAVCEPVRRRAKLWRRAMVSCDRILLDKLGDVHDVLKPALDHWRSGLFSWRELNLGGLRSWNISTLDGSCLASSVAQFLASSGSWRCGVSETGLLLSVS